MFFDRAVTSAICYYLLKVKPDRIKSWVNQGSWCFYVKQIRTVRDFPPFQPDKPLTNDETVFMHITLVYNY